MGELKGKVGLITGAGQGIGQGTALALAGEGCNLVLAGRNLAKVEETARLAVARGVEAIPLACDVKDASDLARAVETAVERLGGLDIVLNNAQEVPLGPLEAVSDEAFLAGFESGPLASFRLMKLARPHLAARDCPSPDRFQGDLGSRSVGSPTTDRRRGPDLGLQRIGGGFWCLVC